jgi:hypothetical protein
MPPKEPTPSVRAPQQSAPFSMPSPFPAPARPRRAKRAVWAAVGVALAAAVQWFLASRGVPAPVIEGAGRALQDVLAK